MRPIIKNCLNTSDNDIDKELYSPLLRWANTYDRGVGYFTSGWLKVNTEAMIEFVKNCGKARWITSPILDGADIDLLRDLESYKEKFEYVNELVDKNIDEIFDGITVQTREFLAWMIFDGIIDIRFALPVNKLSGDFHDKFGIAYHDTDVISFNGSQNDSIKGFSNYESFKVFSSWLGHESFIEDDIRRFEKIWNNQDENLKVYMLSTALKDKIFTKRSKERPYVNNTETSKWAHQDEAVDAFLRKKHGILEMATGTGKTRTAIKIAKKLLQLGQINSIIVTTYGKDLLNQWNKEFIIDDELEDYIIYKKYAKFHELGQFYTNPENSILIISRTPDNLVTSINKLNIEQQQKTLIIFDEIHGLGSTGLRKELKGQIRKIKYRLGLSATPEREYDEEGNEFILDEVGEVFYQFGIDQAIKKGILCEFDYINLEYHLTDEEKKQIKKIIASYDRKRKNGENFKQEDMYRDIANVRKLATEKLKGFDDFIANNMELLNYSIIFVQTGDYGMQVQKRLIKYISDFHVYYADTEKYHLDQFANGSISAIITCRKLNEGIDIKKCKNIILFASDRSRLVTVQRMGRCLRTSNDPNKRATVIDFIDYDSEADVERMNWIKEISKVRRN